MTIKYIEIIVEPDEGGYHAFCPALKGLHTCGDTREEAIKNAGYAVSAYLQSLIKHHEPIPVGVVVDREKAQTANMVIKFQEEKETKLKGGLRCQKIRK